MIDALLSFAIKQRYLLLAVTLIVATYGLFSLNHLPLDAVPDITNNQVQINVAIEGLSPEEMERGVAFPIERALSSIEGLSKSRSLSRYGFSQVTAVFDDTVDLYFARQQIAERLREIQDELPEGAEPKMGAISTGLGEVVMWDLSMKRATTIPPTKEELTYLRTVQDWVIAPQLKGIKGVAAIDSIGGYVKEIVIEPDIVKMNGMNISFEEIVQAVEENNHSLGAGFIERNGNALLVSASQRLKSLEDISSIALRSTKGSILTLGTIANVRYGYKPRSGSASKNGEETVIGTAMMIIGHNSRTVAHLVEQKLEEISKRLPADVQLSTLLTRTKLVDTTINTVRYNLIEGALLVIAVLFFFLRHVGSCLITTAIIPLSMLMAVIAMNYWGVSGNLMSLGAIDFGLIVDGAVIIVENCLRRLNLLYAKGEVVTEKRRLEEIFAATKEMATPSLFGQAIIITVYLPLLSLSGVEGKMFHPMALTVIFALLAACLLSLTFVPAAVALFFRPKKNHAESSSLSFLQKGYLTLLEAAFFQPKVVIGTTISICALATVLFFTLGQEFIPKLDELDLAIQAKRIPGTSIDESTRMQLLVENNLLQHPEVLHVYSKTGTAEMASDPMPPEDSDTFVILKDRREWPDPSIAKELLIDRFQSQLNKLIGNRYEVTQPIEMRFHELIAGVESDLAVNIYGDDFSSLQSSGEQVVPLLRSIEGAQNVAFDPIEGLLLLSLEPNRKLLQLHGLSIKDLLRPVKIAIKGEEAGSIYEGDQKIDLLVRLPESVRGRTSALHDLPIISAKEGVPPILLREVASFQEREGLYEIQREDGKRFIAVRANVRGRDLASFVDEAKLLLDRHLTLPPSSWIGWGGEFEQLLSAKQTLIFVVPVAFSLIWLVLFTAFQSVASATLVFTAVPFAATGGIFALYLRDMDFSISAAVGFIALSGVAVLNGIVLLSCIKSLENGLSSTKEAIFAAAALRLRPVLITAFVASLGFLPMALSTGAGAEVQKPLATVVIGGLFTSTLLTLIVLPTLYYQLVGRKREHTIEV